MLNTASRAYTAELHAVLQHSTPFTVLPHHPCACYIANMGRTMKSLPDQQCHLKLSSRNWHSPAHQSHLSRNLAILFSKSLLGKLLVQSACQQSNLSNYVNVIPILAKICASNPTISIGLLGIHLLADSFFQV